jgi:hypothetical protein
MSPPAAHNLAAVMFLFLTFSGVFISVSATPHNATCQRIASAISSGSHVYYPG